MGTKRIKMRKVIFLFFLYLPMVLFVSSCSISNNPYYASGMQFKWRREAISNEFIAYYLKENKYINLTIFTDGYYKDISSIYIAANVKDVYLNGILLEENYNFWYDYVESGTNIKISNIEKLELEKIDSLKLSFLLDDERYNGIENLGVRIDDVWMPVRVSYDIAIRFKEI